MIERAISLSVLFILAIFITPVLSAPIALWYAFRWFAPELVIMAFFIDTYFGTYGDWPIYTISIALIILTAELAKRYLMIK